jgi:maleylacetoacetate isomerase
MKLYTYFRSSAAFRTRIALNLKGLAYEAVFVPLRSNAQNEPGYLAKNPQGLIPLLEDGGQSLSQSLAIIEYLDETHPEPPFLPGDAAGRAQVRAMALVIACDIHPLNNLRVLKYLKADMGHDQDRIDIWYRHWVSEGFRALEQMVRPAARGTAYCFGGGITLADICLVPQMYNARRVSTDLTPFPKLVAIDAALQQHPAFKAAAPEVQPDAAD